MFNNLSNTQLTDMSDDDLNMLGLSGEGGDGSGEGGDGADQKPPTADKQDKKQPAKQPAKTKSDSPIVATKVGAITDISDDDLSTAMSGQGEEGNDAGDDTDDKGDDDLGDDQGQGDDAGQGDGDDTGAEGDDLDVKDFIKARVSFLIEKGEWVDFEGRDDVEWDEDTFAEMELNQRNYQKEVMREELLDSFGPYGKQIAEYAANGGDADKLIDLFKEEQRIDNLSTDTEDGQRGVVAKYYAQVLGWSEARVNKQIQTLIADKELESTANEFKDLLKKDVEKRSSALQLQQDAANKARLKQQDDNLRQFANDVTVLVNGNTEIPADEKRDIINALTKFDKKTKGGQPVNDFYFKFAEVKKSLPDYINLVRYVLNPKKFTQTLITKGNNTAVDKAFKLTRTANQQKKVKSAGPSGADNPSSTKSKFKLL